VHVYEDDADVMFKNTNIQTVSEQITMRCQIYDISRIFFNVHML
jgi:hypothetical protein